MKVISILCAVLLAVCLRASAATLLTEGFNAATIPAGWATEIVNDPAVDPALTYVTASANPAGFAPYEGTRFVRFNSYDCPTLAAIRLKYTNGFSTVGTLGVEVQVAWTEDDQYSAANDFVTLEWSTNGTDWIAITNYFRYNAAGDAWSVKLANLPAAALNQPNLMLGLLFNSRYGNDCHLDDVQVRSVEANVYVLPATQSKQGLPGTVLAYTVTVTNQTPVITSFALHYHNTNWSESGPALTPLLPSGAATTFVVNAVVPLNAAPDAVNTAMVMAIQAGYSNAATLVSRCTWSQTLITEGFDAAASTNSWATYREAAQELGWLWSTASGNPAPSLRHGDVTVSGIVSNWIVTPLLSLPPQADQLAFSCDFICFATSPRTYYYTGAFISRGSRNPADGDYQEIVRASGALSLLDPVTVSFPQQSGNTSVYIGFLYIGTNSHRMYVDNVRLVASYTGVDNAQVAGPAAIILTSYQHTAMITGLLYKAGETGGAGPAPGYTAQIGYGPRDSGPASGWVWFDAPYVGASGSNDAYARSIPITMAGPFDLAVRFRKSTGPWVAGDLNGSLNGYSSADAIRLDAICPPPHGDLIYQQQMAPPASLYFFGYFAPPGDTNLTADDFTFGSSNMLVQTARWTGYRPAPRVGDPTETGFWLRIYANEPPGGAMPYNHPGAELQREFHEGYACEYATNILWHYQAHLQTPFLALAGSTYWFSAQMQCTTVWGVVNSPTARQGLPLAQSLGDGFWVTNSSNLGMGFELYGIVPEPLGLAIAALGGLLALRWARRT